VPFEILAICDLTNRVGGVSYLLVTNAGGLTVVDLIFSREGGPFEILACFVLLKLLKSFRRLNNGEAVMVTLTIGRYFVVVVVLDVVVTLLLCTSLFGLSLLLFNINIPELDFGLSVESLSGFSSTSGFAVVLRALNFPCTLARRESRNRILYQTHQEVLPS